MKKLISFICDIWKSKQDKNYIINLSSFFIMRRFDMYSLGVSTKILRRYLHRRKVQKNEDGDVIRQIHDLGIRKLGNFDGPHVAELVNLRVSCRENLDISGRIFEAEKQSCGHYGRLDVLDERLLSSVLLAKFITEGPFLRIAKQHYEGDVICVRANSWWSLPTSSKSSLDRSAQKFHRDIDWLGELKFFLFATDVDASNGPFDYILASHRKRLDRFFYLDRRIEEGEMFRVYNPDKFLLSAECSKGDVFVADTRGYHRGRPVINGKRCALSIEFSCSKFGAEIQYQPRIVLNPEWESYPIWKQAILKDSSWSGLFDDRSVQFNHAYT